MCQNSFAQCLIEIIESTLKRGLIVPGRKLISKILILFTMMYKDVHQNFQCEMLEQHMRCLEIPGQKCFNVDLLLTNEEVNKIIGFLCQLIDSDEVATVFLARLTSYSIKSKTKKVFLPVS